MATAVQQPLSASSQSLYVHHNYINSGLIMPSNAPIAPLTTTTSTAPLDPSKRSQQDAANLKQAGSSQTHSHSKKRRFSKGKIPAEIKRSASTPQMRSIAAVDGDSLSPTADKKRNKLGYHRTSVACGHCRRRKIRCLPATDDPQGRCSNCIRLKKECNFYPVDQESQHIQQKSSSSGLKGPTASNPSSPRTIATSSHESIEDFNSYRNVPSNSANSRFVISSDHEGSTASSGGGGGIFQPPSALPPHMNPYGESLEDHWNPGFFTQSLGGDTRYDSQNSAYWRPHESDSTPAYGHDPKPPHGYSQTRIGSVSTLAYTSADDTQNWTAPARAMSYGHIESLAHHDYQDRSAAQFPHPHTLDTSAAITSTTISTPLSAPILGHGMPNYGYQQQWNSVYRAPATVPSDTLQGQAFAPQFYPANPHSLQQMKEEHMQGATSQYAGTPGFYQAPDTQAMR